jgi:uncharacterized protein YecE (DUF72 family)
MLAMVSPRARIRIGLSGWRYAPWRGGAFYPKGLPQRRELEYAASHFPTLELNGSFYSLQRPEYYAEWRDATPEASCSPSRARATSRTCGA